MDRLSLGGSNASLVSVEDMINGAIGTDKNRVNYKMIQAILHLMARQMRVLKSQVDLRICEPVAKKMEYIPSSSSSSISSSDSPSIRAKKEKKQREKREKARREAEEDKAKLDKERLKEEGPDKKAKARIAKFEDKDKQEVICEEADFLRFSVDKMPGLKGLDFKMKEKEKLGVEPITEDIAAKSIDKKEGDQEKESDRELKEREGGVKPVAEHEEGDEKLKKKGKKVTKDTEGKDKHAKKKSKEEGAEEPTDEDQRAKHKDKKAKLGKATSEERAEHEKEAQKRDKKETDKEKDKKDKMSPEEREAYEKEKERLDRMSQAEREKYDKEKEEREKIKKMSPKEREMYEKERERKEKGAEKTPSGTGISIKDSERKGEKIFVVEKGPTTHGAGRLPRVGSVECVTRSEFELLEAAVNNLKKKAGPLPMPAMPDNKRLLDDIAKGSATLPDTMHAMQMAARLQAAEAAIERLAGLLTQLAASGVLPKDMVKKIDVVMAGLQTMGAEGDDKSKYGSGGRTSVMPSKSVGIDPRTMKSMAGHHPSVGSTMISGRASEGRSSLSSRMSAYGASYVTHIDLGDAVENLMENMMSYVDSIQGKAQANCEASNAALKSVGDKMAIALKLNGRLSMLTSLVGDYSQQLQGFDAGLGTQMAGFHEQISLLRKDLAGGLKQMEKANNNAETDALNELNDRYESLLNELDSTQNDHGKLTLLQNQLADDLRGLMVAVEILQEQKADRDEVLDGLRDKADSSSLKGLLTEKAFAIARGQLEDSLERCYDKFRKQENVWTDALKDLSDISAQKAELMMLLAAKDDAEKQLRGMQERLDKLALALGEPMAAIVTRQVSKDATCASCMVPALQSAVETSFGKPPALPRARPTPLGQEEPCTKDVERPPYPSEDRPHTCHRWVGGSHTLVSGAVRRVQAPAAPAAPSRPPLHVYSGQGTDGRLYVMETEMVPCEECNACRREKLPNEDPLQTAHNQVCFRDDNDKQVIDVSPPVCDGAGDTGG